MNHSARLLYAVQQSDMRTALGTPRAWGAILASYIAWLHASGIPDTTMKLRSYHLRRFALDSGLGPHEVTLDALVQHIGGRSWSANYKRSVRTTMRSFYAWAELTGQTATNPAMLLPAISAPLGKPRPAPERALSSALTTASERSRLMIMLAAQAGLRCREIALVHSRDIEGDLLGWSLRVHGKGARTRLVPLNDKLARKLREQPMGFVFPGQIDGHLSASYVSKLLSRALPDDVTGHRLRHRFASVAFAAERDIRAVQELLGHASVATTQIYTAVPDGALRRAVQAAA